jgi:hypothetical protein
MSQLYIPSLEKGSIYRVYMRRDNLFVPILPPPPVMILVETLNIQLNGDKTHWRYTLPVYGILHWE